MTNICLTIVISCLIGSFLIEARAHYLINKAMHRRVVAMFVDYSSDGQQSNSNNQKQKNIQHRSSPLTE